jgi:hypothetical protein
VADSRGGTWGPGPAPTSEGGGYEQAQQPQTKGETHGPTYETVVSEKDSSIRDAQDPHFLGQLLPASHSRSEEVRSFFDATSVLG